MIKQKFDRDSTIKELPLLLGMYMEDYHDMLFNPTEAALLAHKFDRVYYAIFEDNISKLDDSYIISKGKADIYYSNKWIPETTYVAMEDCLLIANTLKTCIPPDGSRTFDTRNVERQLIKQITNKGNNMEFIKGQTIKVKNNDDTEWETRIFKDKDDQGFWCYCIDTESPRMAFCWDQAQPQLTIKVADNWRKDSIFCDCELCKSLNKEK